MMAQTLQEKLAGLEAQFKQLADNANAVAGAIQFCKVLIQEEADSHLSEVKE